MAAGHRVSHYTPPAKSNEETWTGPLLSTTLPLSYSKYNFSITILSAVKAALKEENASLNVYLSCANLIVKSRICRV